MSTMYTMLKTFNTTGSYVGECTLSRRTSFYEERRTKYKLYEQLFTFVYEPLTIILIYLEQKHFNL